MYKSGSDPDEESSSFETTSEDEKELTVFKSNLSAEDVQKEVKRNCNLV